MKAASARADRFRRPPCTILSGSTLRSTAWAEEIHLTIRCEWKAAMASPPIAPGTAPSLIGALQKSAEFELPGID